MSVKGNKKTTSTLQGNNFSNNFKKSILKKRGGGDIYDLDHELSDEISHKSSKKLKVQNYEKSSSPSVVTRDDLKTMNNKIMVLSTSLTAMTGKF